MKNVSQNRIDNAIHLFSKRIVFRLDLGVGHLSYDVIERLRAGRVQALAQRKRAAAAVTQPVSAWSRAGASLVIGGSGSDDGAASWWRPLVSIVPVLVLVAGLMVMGNVQDETGTSEVAEVDAALLTDTLPPAAYADPGFVQFLKTRADENL